MFRIGQGWHRWRALTACLLIFALILHSITFAIAGERFSADAADIDSIKEETSNVHTTAALRRPFRRIAIYSEQNGQAERIDISLKIFVQTDIKTLMEIIKANRPDLPVPTSGAKAFE
jgi:hypothetical protein